MNQLRRIFAKVRGTALLSSIVLIAAGVQAKTFYVDYSHKPNPDNLIASDLAILSVDAEFDMARLHRAGNEVFAYVSVGEIAKDAPYREKTRELGIASVAKNKVWNSDVVDLSAPKWIAFVTEELAGAAVAKNFDGFFLDTADTVDTLAETHPERAKEFRQGLIDIIAQLKARYPGKKIIVNRGFTVFEEVKSKVDGILIESLFQTYDFEKKSYAKVEKEAAAWVLERARKAKESGLPVYIIDYVSPSDRELAAKTAEAISREGFIPFITTPDLDGVMLAPLQRKKRTALVLFGNTEGKPDENVLWPFDSFVGRYLQMPLEYLGVEARYQHIGDGLPEELGQDVCGIIVDRTLQVPARQEAEFLKWLAGHKKEGVRIVFFGDIPVDDEILIAEFAQEFGLRGDISSPLLKRVPEIEKFEPKLIGFEAKPVPQSGSYFNLQAPAGAEVYLRLRGEAESGSPVYFEPIYVASWGGMSHWQYTSFLRADMVNLWVIDPFAFLTRALDLKPFPAPDTTTRDGRRIFYSHIDGDGFSDYTTVKDGEMSSEIVRDRIIKRFPVPITVSVIEAEMRGVMKIQPRGISPKLIKIARSIFELPNVQAASHAYSHPFYWIKGDPEATKYDHAYVPLKERYQGKASDGFLDYEREIDGSCKYIEENLLPKGKKIEVFLWSGNCRPPSAALRRVRLLGIENMNGGDTVITRAKSSLSCVSARTMPWDDELQIFAANQNENVYTNDWTGALFGTFRQVIDTFEMTEKPRRLKPVNIYYHFYSADRPDAFRGLELAYEWAMTQPLHCITAAEYARIAKDSRRTAIYQTTDGRWILVNHGILRTFRVPKSMGYPDLNRSRGILGYKSEGDQTYIHTSGAGKATLYMTEQPRPHLYLVSSTAPGRCDNLASGSFQYSFEDYREGELVLGGIASGSTLQVDCEGTSSTHTPDGTGTVTIKLPKRGTVRCKVL